MAAMSVAGQDPRRGQPDEHVGAPHRPGQVPGVAVGVGVLRDPAQALVQARPAQVHRPLVVADHDVGGAGPRAEQQLEHGGARGARARPWRCAPRGSFLPTTRSALVSAAITTIAVPCWSSWNTGMSSSPRSLRSTSKQRGALMSSRLMPPNPGAMSCTARTISSVSWLSRQIGQASMSANRLNRAALPSMTGSAAYGPMLPRPSTAEPSVTTATEFRLMVRRRASSAVPRDRHRDPAHAGGVRHGQVVPVPQRHLGAHLDLPAQVQQERAVADLVHGHAVDAASAVTMASACSVSARGAGDVDPQPVVRARRSRPAPSPRRRPAPRPG